MRTRILLLIYMLSCTVCFSQEDTSKRNIKSFDNEYNEYLRSSDIGYDSINNNKKEKLYFEYIIGETKAEKYNWRDTYLNLGFINSKMIQVDAPVFKRNYGVSLTFGHTFALHKRPIARIMRIGLDATWLDLNYTNYKIKHITYWGTYRYQYHQGEVSVHIGPSITIAPIRKFEIKGYFRYAPSYSVLYKKDTYYGNYATFFVGGASISYGAIGLGIESRFGNCKYRELGAGSDNYGSPVNRTKYNGWNAYLTFRF